MLWEFALSKPMMINVPTRKKRKKENKNTRSIYVFIDTDFVISVVRAYGTKSK